MLQPNAQTQVAAPPARADASDLIALRSGVQQVTDRDNVVHLMSWPHGLRLGRLTEDQHHTLARLAQGPCSRAELDARGPVAALLAQLDEGGWLATTITADGHRLCTFDPLSPPPARPDPVIESPVLSRFTIIRRGTSELVAESARAWCDLRIHDGSVIGVMTGGDSGLPPDVATYLRDRLCASRFMVAAGSEESDFATRLWGPHELWFHDRSRLGHRGTFGGAFGGTFWARDRFTPPPGRHPSFPGRRVALAPPDLDALAATDPPFSTVLEARHSMRTHHNEKPLELDRLAEFLYRCGRIRARRTSDEFEYLSRPYPSGGGAYELEIYPVVTRMSGLGAGMYHYDSASHELAPVADAEHPGVRRIVRVATSAAGGQTPQVILVISARLGRLAWKYEGMPYALMLKHVGALYQTMYCVATAMGLAACGLGAGDSSAFAETTGLDPLEESSVGEFALGAYPDHPPRRGEL